MQQFESDFLAKYTLCNYIADKDLALALGIIHVEFILIHSFREGNGRVARLLVDLMAMQSNRPSLNYSAIDRTQNTEGFAEYIHAIYAGFNGDYNEIRNIFMKLLAQSS